MITTKRAVVESPITQGTDERIAYTLLTTPWGSNPSSVVVTIFDKDRLDCSVTCLTGSASVVGDIITSPIVHSLTNGKTYHLEFKFTISGNVFEAFVVINAEY